MPQHASSGTFTPCCPQKAGAQHPPAYTPTTHSPFVPASPPSRAHHPQLYLNYKLKSVAHLPWRQMTYKFLNTIIDDLFAFVIKMPTLHRLAVFRDDIIFLIFLYQVSMGFWGGEGGHECACLCFMCEGLSCVCAWP